MDVKKNSFEKLQKVDLQLEDLEYKNGKTYFTAKSITKDFVCEKGLIRLAKNSVGKPLIWRHEHPILIKKNHIYGEVVESDSNNSSITSTYEVYNHTKDHKKFVKILKDRKELGEPLSISMRFRTYFNENGDPVHFDVIEHSATPTPACKECVVLDIKNEDLKMPDEKKIKQEIEKLESELTKKDEILEELQDKVKELQSEISLKDEQLEKAEEEKSTVSAKLDEFKDKLLEQKVMIDKLQEASKMDKLLPMVEKILEYPTEDMMESIYMDIAREKDFEEAKGIFEKKLEKLEKSKEVLAVSKSMSKTGQESIQEKELEMSPEEEKKLAKKALKYSPELYKKLYGDK